MIPANLNFWSISRKESLESQENHAHRNKFLKALFCSNEIFIPGYNRKMLIRKRASTLDKSCFNKEQLFHPLQWTGCKKCQGSSIDRLVLPRVTGVLPTSDQPHYLWGISYFGNGRRQYSTCRNQSWSSHITFLLPFYVVHFRQEFFLGKQPSQCLVIVAIKLQLL